MFFPFYINLGNCLTEKNTQWDTFRSLVTKIPDMYLLMWELKDLPENTSPSVQFEFEEILPVGPGNIRYKNGRDPVMESDEVQPTPPFGQRDRPNFRASGCVVRTEKPHDQRERNVL